LPFCWWHSKKVGHLMLEMLTLWSTNITMENHHFYRANQLFLRPCSIAFCLFTRVYPRPDDRCHVAGRYHPRSK
jgi:hypothetical protein